MLQRGLAPVSVGRMLGGCVSLANGALTGWIALAIAGAVFELVLRTPPALLILGGPLIGLVAFVG